MSNRITVTVRMGQKEQRTEHDKRKNLLETFVEKGFVTGGLCRSVSLCGGCKVRFVKGAPFPSVQDRMFFSAEELREGFRLACHAKPIQDCIVEVEVREQPEMEIVDGCRMENRPDRDLKNKDSEAGGKYFFAVDIGTTTVVMQLVECFTGQVAGTVKFMNPQRKYGLDVVSRIQAAKTCGDVMQRCIREAVVKGAEQLKERWEKEDGVLPFMCITGNTAMLHIFMGYDTTGLGESPFSPVTLQCEETTFAAYKAVLMPGISAFVGADVTAGILATGMQQEEAVNLLIDLGTNGELAMGNREQILTCATAAGPAFEGGAEKGIFGADIIGAIACLLADGKVKENGYMEKTYCVSYGGKEITVTQEKIREIQLAKGAIRAGIESLLKRYGLSSYGEIGKVYLAGGFGKYLDREAAVQIGLLPEELLEKTEAVGNSALAGAKRFGRMMLLETGTVRAEEKCCYEETAVGLQSVTSFNLAEDKEFLEKYIQYMDFPVKK